MMVKVHLEVDLRGEAMTTGREHEGSLSSLGVQLDPEGAISPKNLCTVLIFVLVNGHLIFGFDIHHRDVG